ncbi:MAG: isocitrate lyase/phosphoenolpyruvate mutase family protein [Phycisphaerales bacterium]
MPTARTDASTPPAHPGAHLRALMDAGCVATPGAFNGLVARAVADAGFDACYVSGGAISAASGVPDIGLLGLDHFCQIIRQVATSSGLPVLSDADTGFGEGEMTARAVWDYSNAGAAGFHIEDQVFPKRCGHLDGKSLVSIEHFQEKVAMAAQARDACSGGAFLVCARTDARGVEGFDRAVERAKAYVDAGADMLFPEGLASEEEFGRFADALRGYGARKGPYLLANMTEFGKTPMLSLGRFADLGYHCVIYPVTTLRLAMHAVTESLRALKAEESAATLLDRMQTRKELYALLRYTPGEAWAFPSAAANHPTSTTPAADATTSR